jgi:hypothetical protein
MMASNNPARNLLHHRVQSQLGSVISSHQGIFEADPIIDTNHGKKHSLIWIVLHHVESWAWSAKTAGPDLWEPIGAG